jgi:glycosyltransferase involved in cell wall biosynthesis
MDGVRVALDVTALYSARTGVGVFTEELLRRLAVRDDLSVVAYAVTWRGRGRLAALLPAGVARARGPMAAQPLRAAWRRADRPPIEWWTGAVDVVHGPNFVVPPTRHGAALATVHDLTPIHFPELSTADTLQYPDLVRRALRRGAHLHVVSAFVRDEVLECLGAPAERVHVVPNGVTPVVGGDAGRGRAVAGGRPYVLALGTVEPRKDLPMLVGAFDAVAADHPDLSLVVAGPDGWGLAAYDAAVAAAHHRDRIVRVGWVADAERADLLAGAAVFAYPSRYEGFGLPPLEAMTAGVPVVTTTAGALPEVVGDAAELVRPGDGDGLAAAITRLLDDGDRRRELVAAGHARALRFSWDATAEGIVGVYGTIHR